MASTPMSSSHDTWTDDLTIQCVHTGLGCSTSKLYSRDDEQTASLHEYMHKSFGFELKSDYLYGILTGFNNSKAVKFFTTHLPLVISDRINNDTSNDMLNSSEEELYYKNLLSNAFQTVEQQFLQENEDQLNEKTFIDIQLQEEIQSDPKTFDRLKELSSELSSGLSAVVALIHNNRIYTANVGNTKAILCKKVYRDNGQEYIASVEMSTNHDLDNPKELDRWKQIGVNIDESNKLQQTLTRCLGDLWHKSFYKDYSCFASATQDPILATPDIVSIPIDNSCLFLILTSGSLLSSLKEATGHSSDHLVQLVCDEFDQNSNLNQISQSIVDHICEKHQECFHANINSPTGNSRTKCRQIDDITLLIRNLKIENQKQIPIINITGKLDELSIDTLNDEGPQGTSTIIDNDKTLVNTDSNDYQVASDNENDEESDQEDEEIDAYVDFSELSGMD